MIHFKSFRWARIAVKNVLSRSKLQPRDLSSVAVTTSPGRSICLNVGLSFAKDFCTQHALTIIPVHHMRAHALVARMFHPEIKYPFLNLLISGGHCLLAVAESAEQFYLLGEGDDIAPGHYLDCVANEMGLNEMPEFKNRSGGASLDQLALEGDATKFSIKCRGIHTRNICNFSFNGVLNTTKLLVHEWKDRPEYMDVLPHLAATTMRVVTQHLMHRLTRAVLFLHENKLNVNRTLVVSGGCACSRVIKRDLQKLCDYRNFSMFVPPPEMCIDNAVMIGYMAHEMTSHGFQPITNLESVHVEAFDDIGYDVTETIRTNKRVSNNFDRLTGVKLIAPELNNVNNDHFSTDFSTLVNKT